MIRHRLLLVILSVLLLSYSDKKRDVKKWDSLFNGKDLNGWQMKISGYPVGENFGNTFRVEDRILQIRYNAYDSFRNRFGAIYYKKQFRNFRLKVEYRFVGETTVGAPSWGYRDSGIQYDCQSAESMQLNQSFPVCLEYNLHGGNGKDERPTGEICTSGTYVSVNGQRPASNCSTPTVKRTFHGNEWVTAEIEVRGDKIKHFVNGEEILQYENPRYDPNHAIGKTFIINGDDKVKDGYISLQSNSHPIDFRKIEIMELK
jgi:hypothetical protein